MIRRRKAVANAMAHGLAVAEAKEEGSLWFREIPKLQAAARLVLFKSKYPSIVINRPRPKVAEEALAEQ